MKNKIYLSALVFVILLCLININGLFSQETKESDSDKEAEARRALWDKGPRTIDVSQYPAEMQSNYKIFVQRCSKCHNLARPINSDYCLSDEWERYVKRMLRKPGSGIAVPDGKKIYDFLAYDSGIRKKDCIERKTKKTEPQQ